MKQDIEGRAGLGTYLHVNPRFATYWLSDFRQVFGFFLSL